MNTIYSIKYQFICTAELDFDCIIFHRYILLFLLLQYHSPRIHVFSSFVHFLFPFLFCFLFFTFLSCVFYFVVQATEQIEWMIRSNHLTGLAIFRP